MKPVLLSWGPLLYFSYGIFLALGFVAAAGWAESSARRKGLPRWRCWDLLPIVFLAGLLGGKGVHLLFRALGGDPEPSGQVLHGGMAAAALALWAYARFRRVPTGIFWDLVGTALPLGICLGRLGCLCYGCCYGRPGHPAQLYESIGALALWAFLAALHRRSVLPGRLAWASLLGYGVLRTVVETFRADPVPLLGSIRLPILISIALVIFSLALLCLSQASRGSPAIPLDPGRPGA